MAAPLKPDDTASIAPADGPVNILLVDDQPTRLLTYRAILGSLHENLIEASSGTEALKLLMQHDFAMILLDVNSPAWTVSRLRIDPSIRASRIRRSFSTAVNLTDLDRMRGYRLGALTT